MDKTNFVAGTEYFCWVRMVRLSDRVTTSPVTRVDPDSPEGKSGDVHGLHWDLRARGVVSRAHVVASGQPASNDPVGVWSASRGLEGRDGADTAFDLGPAFSTESAALGWLANSVSGRRWDSESINRILMRFVHYAGPSGLKFLSPAEAEQRAEKIRSGLTCKVSQDKKELKFHEGTLSLKGPEDYVSDPNAEFETLIRYQADRGAFRAQIERESLNAYQAVSSVLSAMGLQNDLPAYPAVKAVCDYLLEPVRNFVCEA
jgi:hypothetical protein